MLTRLEKTRVNKVHSARRYCALHKTQFSAPALGKWGVLLEKAHAVGATVAELDEGMYAVSPRGLTTWCVANNIPVAAPADEGAKEEDNEDDIGTGSGDE